MFDHCGFPSGNPTVALRLAWNWFQVTGNLSTAFLALIAALVIGAGQGMSSDTAYIANLEEMSYTHDQVAKILISFVVVAACAVGLSRVL